MSMAADWWASLGGSMIDLTGDDSGNDDVAIPESFPNGTFRLTFNRFASFHRGEYITFDEILGSMKDVTKVILSSYCIDEEWIFSKLARVPEVIAITHWDRNEVNASIRPGARQHPCWRNVTLVLPEFPRFPNYGVMHSKLILIYRPKRLRVVISTGNLIEYDYEEAVFIQDLSVAEEEATYESPQFYTGLNHVLGRLGVASKDARLDRYDWRPVSALLLASEPGYHFTDGKNMTGLAALTHLSSRWHPSSPSTDLRIEYQCSSLGKLDGKWLADVHQCCTGKSISDNEAEKAFRIVFPTLDSVKRSPLGPGAFGTIFCKSKDWSASSTPRSSFYQCVSTGRAGRPLHMKIMTVWQGERLLYTYLGSHNFTPSAWGRFVKEGRQQLISNFELGVLLDPQAYPPLYAYKRPAAQYTQADAPWTQDLYLC